MDLKLSHCFVYVLDQDEALDFYTRVLGMEKRSDAQMEHMRWLTVGPPSQPDLEINLRSDRRCRPTTSSPSASSSPRGRWGRSSS
jgi:catechol 2,3-dioxygenase-like lactoylglutathione lyase family enzyme